MRLVTEGLSAPLERAVRTVLDGADGPLTCIVGATAGTIGAALAIEAAEWSAMIERLDRAFFTAQQTAKTAIDANAPARLIFISSPPAVRAIAGKSSDAIAGAFLTTVAEVAAVELGPHDITSNVVVAGWMEAESPAQVIDGIPSGRFASPAEIANVCAFLVSPAASYISGATISVDGAFSVSKGGANPFIADGRTQNV